MLAADAVKRYEEREEVVTPETMRQVERQIMLRLIDQKWREHLYSMDYLREGIHLRAMGQKDPATEWQREGYDMFGQMVSNIDSEFVRYIMHVEVKKEEDEDSDATSDSSAKKASAPVSPVIEATATKADASGTSSTPAAAPAATPQPAPAASKTPKVNSEFENVGRNEPCPCGTGKKFKHCHGR